MTHPRLPLPFLLVSTGLAFAACLENEEEIEVRPDGSVRVTVSAKGDLADLADGHPVPLGPGWELVSEDARRWLRDIGADTGSADSRQRVREIERGPERASWKGAGQEDPPGATLVVQREFASVSDVPRWLAPEDEPYRTAHLERGTTLDIRELGDRRVFVFERVFHGFERGRLDLSERLDLPPELEQKLESEEPLTAAERSTIAERAGGAYEELAVEFARDALLGIYTAGDASLPPALVPDVLERVRAAARATVTPARLARLLDAVEADRDAAESHGGEKKAKAGAEEAPRLFEELEADWRRTLRASLDDALAGATVSPSTRNAALYALEWQFTAFDHFGDLGDESFVVRLRLPGTLVGGNYASAADGVASWKFEGKELQQKDVVLRAVSVLE